MVDALAWFKADMAAGWQTAGPRAHLWEVLWLVSWIGFVIIVTFFARVLFLFVFLTVFGCGGYMGWNCLGKNVCGHICSLYTLVCWFYSIFAHP